MPPENDKPSDSPTRERRSRRPSHPPEFDSDRCKSCGICINFCPKGLLIEGPEGVPEISDPEACNACRLCELMCPDFAVRFPETEGEEPQSDDGSDA